jgi:hypothetical protein
MGYGLDLPRLHLPVSLHRKGGELVIVGCSGGLEWVHETLPKRLSQDSPLPRWQAERLSRNLVNAHHPNILAKRPDGKRGLLTHQYVWPEFSWRMGCCGRPSGLIRAFLSNRENQAKQEQVSVLTGQVTLVSSFTVRSCSRGYFWGLSLLLYQKRGAAAQRNDSGRVI